MWNRSGAPGTNRARSMPLAIRTIGTASAMAGNRVVSRSAMSPPTSTSRCTCVQSTRAGKSVCNASIECKRRMQGRPASTPEVVAHTAWSQHHSSQTMSASAIACASAGPGGTQTKRTS